MRSSRLARGGSRRGTRTAIVSTAAAVASATVELLEPRTLFSSPSLWTSHGNGGGGNFLYPSIDPRDSAKLTVASDMTGQYRSTDGGATWKLTDTSTFRAEPKVDNTVRYTALPGVALALNDRTLIYDNGSTPMRTADDGATWQPLSGWSAVGSDAWSLNVDYADPSRVFVSSYSQLFFSRDGGATFAPVATQSAGDNGLFVAGAAFDGQTIYVATSTISGNRVLRSTDGGVTFAPFAIGGLTDSERIYSFGGSRIGSGALRLVAVTANKDNPDTFNGDWYPGLPQQPAIQSFQSLVTADDVRPAAPSASWTRRINAGAAVNPVRLGQLATTAANPQVVYSAGDNPNNNYGVVLKSVDGGATWTNVLQEAGNHQIATGWLGDGGDLGWDYAGNIVGIAVSQGDADALLVTDFMTAQASNDGGAHWHAVYVNPADRNAADTTTPKRKAYRGSGLEDTSVWDLDFVGASTVLGSYTDVAARRSTDGGASWAAENFAASGTPNSVFSIAQAGNVLLAGTSTVHDLYQDGHESAPAQNDNGLLLYSTDTGASWHAMYDFGAPVVWVAMEPGSSSRAYAAVDGPPGVGGIYRSDDVNTLENNGWSHLPDPPGTKGSAYNIRPLGGNKLLVSFASRDNTLGASGIFYSPDGGVTWQNKTGSGGGGAMNQRTKDVVPDPADPLKTWFAAVRQTADGTGGLYRTINGNAATPTWTKVMPAVGVESITIAGDEAFVTTLNDGLWYSSDIHAASAHFAKTDFPFARPLRVFVDPAYASNHQIWVTTFGAGIWTGVTQAPQTPVAVTSADHEYATQPNRLRVTFNQDVSGATGALKDQFTVTRLTAPAGTVATSNFAYNATTHTATLDLPAGLVDGNYRLTIAAGAVAGAGAGNTLAATFNYDFFSLIGDADRDRTVGPSDFNLLASHFGLSGQTWSAGDFDADGVVGPGDFNLLASRFGTTLAAPPPPAIQVLSNASTSPPASIRIDVATVAKKSVKRAVPAGSVAARSVILRRPAIH